METMAKIPPLTPTVVSVGPLLLWFVVQLAALLLSALRVPLAAQFPQPAEFQAVRVLLAIQFAWVAIVFPMLLINWRMAVLALASAWVMLALAAGLSAWTFTLVLPAAGYLAVWIIVLWTWRAGLVSAGQQSFAAAVMATYFIGGALLWYVQLDFGVTSPAPASLVNGPLLMIVANPQHPPAGGWILAAVMEAAALIVLMVWRRRNAANLPRTKPTEPIRANIR
jgi:hypothetical protein